MTVEEKIQKTVKWLREKVEEAHAQGLIVGVSGGIDSAVVACLIEQACPGKAIGIILPVKNSKEDLVDAQDAIVASGILGMTLELGEAHNDILRPSKAALQEKGLWQEAYARMTDANLRARLRMATLYTLANNLGYMVVGTDNAAEILTGYFTKYGDGGVDLLPLANLPKHEVYEWGEYLGVPKSILKKAPSAGLWEGQTDENEMGVTYQSIDRYLSGKEILEKDRKQIEKLHAQTQHKRQTPPSPPVWS